MGRRRDKRNGVLRFIGAAAALALTGYSASAEAQGLFETRPRGAPVPPAGAPPAAPPPGDAPSAPAAPPAEELQRKATYSDGRELDLSGLRLDTLAPFGANMFLSDTVAESTAGVSPDYEIAIGDRVEVWLWGAVEQQTSTVVDGQGNIFIPKIGPIRVAGLKFRDLTARVMDAVRTVYTSNVNVYTSLPQAASIGVFVTGFVRAPGRHLGRSTDSIITFLRRAGGIDPVRGSYRTVIVRRNGEPIQHVALYPFLRDGVLPRLQFMEGDTIVVGARQPIARVGGAAQNPAIYEMSGRLTSGRQIVFFARPEAAASHVYLRSSRGGRTSQIFVPLREFAAMTVSADDEIVFFKDTVKPHLTVVAEGAVIGQSVFAVERGTRLSHVLHFIRTDPKLADLGAIHIRRKSVAETQRRILDETLQRVQEALFKSEKLSRGEFVIRVREAELLKMVIATLEKVRPSGIVVLSRNGASEDITLEHEDIIVVPARSDIVAVGGEVVAPQTFRHDPAWTVADYLRKSGGVTELGRGDQYLVYHRNGEVSIGNVTAVRPGDQILFLPYIRTNFLQVALDIGDVIARALVLGRLATVF